MQRWIRFLFATRCLRGRDVRRTRDAGGCWERRRHGHHDDCGRKTGATFDGSVTATDAAPDAEPTSETLRVERVGVLSRRGMHARRMLRRRCVHGEWRSLRRRPWNLLEWELRFLRRRRPSVLPGGAVGHLLGRHGGLSGLHRGGDHVRGYDENGSGGSASPAAPRGSDAAAMSYAWDLRCARMGHAPLRAAAQGSLVAKMIPVTMADAA